ncbi:chaperonin 10-like protein [Schizophyllum fasciatum]
MAAPTPLPLPLPQTQLAVPQTQLAVPQAQLAVPQTQLAVLVGPAGSRLATAPVPAPGAHEVLIATAVAASNPKDWKIASGPKDGKIATWRYGAGEAFAEGNDVAGVVVAVGARGEDGDEGGYEREFAPGMRVGAFTKMGTRENKYGAYQQYTVAPASTTFPIGDSTSFEEAATLPLAVMTAALGLFVRLGASRPGEGEGEAAPATNYAILINGAATSVGAFAVQLAKRAGLFVVGTAGASGDYATELGADVVVDYRDYGGKGEGEGMIDALVAAAGGRPTPWALDAVSERGSALVLARALDRLSSPTSERAAVATVLDVPAEQLAQFPPRVAYERIKVGTAYGEDERFAAEYYRKIARWLADGSFRANRARVMPRGLASVPEGLELLRAGKVHAEKLVYRIADTPGVEA